MMVLLLAAGCAGPTEVSVPAELEEVEVEARNFEFSPDVIRTQAGRTLNLQVKSHSATEHNITVKDPAGKILVSRDLPAQETVTVAVPLRERGEYLFYCDQTLHAALGMKGRVVAE